MTKKSQYIFFLLDIILDSDEERVHAIYVSALVMRDSVWLSKRHAKQINGARLFNSKTQLKKNKIKGKGSTEAAKGTC